MVFSVLSWSFPQKMVLTMRNLWKDLRRMQECVLVWKWILCMQGSPTHFCSEMSSTTFSRAYLLGSVFWMADHDDGESTNQWRAILDCAITTWVWMASEPLQRTRGREGGFLPRCRKSKGMVSFFPLDFAKGKSGLAQRHRKHPYSDLQSTQEKRGGVNFPFH